MGIHLKGIFPINRQRTKVFLRHRKGFFSGRLIIYYLITYLPHGIGQINILATKPEHGSKGSAMEVPALMTFLTRQLSATRKWSEQATQGPYLIADALLIVIS